MSHLKLFRRIIAFILLANLVDAISTYFLLQTGRCYEVTPWINALIQNHGYSGAVVFKMIVSIPIASLFLIKKPSKIALYAAETVAAVFGFLMLWHFFLIMSILM